MHARPQLILTNYSLCAIDVRWCLQSMHYDFLHFIAQCSSGVRLLTYNSLEGMYTDTCAKLAAMKPNERRGQEKPAFPWKRMAINTIVKTESCARRRAVERAATVGLQNCLSMCMQ